MKIKMVESVFFFTGLGFCSDFCRIGQGEDRDHKDDQQNNIQVLGDRDAVADDQVPQNDIGNGISHGSESASQPGIDRDARIHIFHTGETINDCRPISHNPKTM